MLTRLPKFAAVAALTLAAAAPLWAATEMIDQVVAIVDDDVVMASELRERLKTITENIETRGAEMPPEDVLIRETLDRLILESIQMQMGTRYGVRIADAQLDAAMGRIAAQNRLSPEQFAALLAQEGQSYGELRENIRREMIIQRVQQGNVNQLIQITDQEIENYLATEEGQKLVQPEYRIVHALLPIASDASPEEIARSEAYCEGLIQRIQGGEAFDEVMANATEYTFNGGDLGWRKLDDVPSIFQEVAQQLELGETADLFRSPSGWHIVNMADRRGGGNMTISQTKVRHILVKPSEILTDEQARQRVADIKRRVEEDGEDFGALAQEYSEDIGSATEGGELGWTNPGQMVPEFENTMASTEVGTLSAPVRTQFGWHVLEVMDRREKDMTNEMRRAQIEEFLHSRKYQEELDVWLRKVRDEAFVDIK